MHKMRAVLALLTALGFLGVLCGLLWGPVEFRDSPTVQIMLGSLSTAYGFVMNWHFGSSSGSEMKSNLLAKAAPIPPTEKPQ